MAGIREKQLDTTFTAALARDEDLSWRAPVAVLHLIGNATVATINGLTPASGDAYVVTDAGTLTTGSLAVVAGDLVEYSGTAWVKIVSASGGFVPADTRAVLATQTALISPYTDTTDDAKIVSFTGASNTGVDTSERVDGYAIIVNGASSVHENKGFVYSGASVTWVTFGAGSISAGNGLSFSGTTLNVGGSGRAIQVNADDLEFDASEAASTGLEASTNPWQLRLATQGNGIAGGAGSTLSVDPDSETGGNIQPVNVTANGVGLDINAIAGTGLEADGSANLRLATQGNGIAGGAGSTLSVDPDSETGGDIQPVSVTANGVGLDVSAIAGTGLAADGSANLGIQTSGATVTFLTGAWTFPTDVLQVTGTPDSANDAVNKTYVDNVVSGITWKEPVAVRGLIGNVVTETLIGNATIATLNGLTPTAGDAYVAADAGTPTAGTSDALVAGSIAEFDGTSWIELVAGSGGFVPNGTTALLSMTTALIPPYTDVTDDGKIAKFGGASNTASLVTQVAGDAVVISAPDGTGVDQGDLKEYSGSAWVEIVAGVGGFVPDGTRVILSEQSLLVSPYVEATDNDKILSFDGASNTGTSTGEASNGNALLVSGQGSYYEGLGFAYDGTVPAGTWNQFTGAGQINAGTGLSLSGNTLNVGDAGKGIQVNANDLEFSASEAASTGLEASANSWQLRIAAQGNGLTGGGGTTLSVLANGDSIDVSASGVKAAVPSKLDKNVTSAVTTGADDTTGVTISATPAGDGYVAVGINTAAGYEVGDGVKTKDFYFSGDGGTTARAISAIVSGDTLYQGSALFFNLDTDDKISLFYNVIV